MKVDHCICCNVHPDDIVEITEEGDPEPSWCCSQCDAVWIQSPGSCLVQILAEGYIP